MRIDLHFYANIYAFLLKYEERESTHVRGGTRRGGSSRAPWHCVPVALITKRAQRNEVVGAVVVSAGLCVGRPDVCMALP